MMSIYLSTVLIFLCFSIYFMQKVKHAKVSAEEPSGNVPTALSHLGSGHSNTAHTEFSNNDKKVIAELKKMIFKKVKKNRAFVFVFHEDYGYLVLRTRKKKKIVYQMPGGRIDEEDIDGFVKNLFNSFKQTFINDSKNDGKVITISDIPSFEVNEKLLMKYTAARELYEETAIYLHNLDRLEIFSCPDIENYFFYNLKITNDDAPIKNTALNEQSLRKLVHPDNNEDFQIILSNEHTGFRFEKNRLAAADLVALHSKGRCTEALLSLVF